MLSFIFYTLIPHCINTSNKYIPKYTKNNVLYTFSFLFIIISDVLVVTFDLIYGNTAFITN